MSRVSPLRDKEKLEKAISNSNSIKEALRFLGLKETGGNYANFKKYCAEFNLTPPVPAVKPKEVVFEEFITCKQCKQEKPRDKFWNKKSKANGKNSFCIPCMKEKDASYIRVSKPASGYERVAFDKSLSVLAPHILSYLDDDNVNPKDVSPGSNYIAHWSCPHCLSSWDCTVARMFQRKNPCTICHNGKLSHESHESRRLSDVYNESSETNVYTLNIGVHNVNNAIAVTHKRAFALWNDIVNPKCSQADSVRFKLNFLCPRNHHFLGFLHDVERRGCLQCKQEDALLVNRARTKIIEEYDISNPIPVSEISYNSARVVTWSCLDCGNNWDAPVYQRVNSASDCPRCSFGNISRGEEELYDFISSCYTGEIVRNSRKVIFPLELDIYLPELAIAIEYNGLYFHSEAHGKDRNYHKNKWQQCKDKGIQLISVWEDDWRDDIKQGIVKSMLLHKLGISAKERVYGRKCVLKVVDSSTARDFCNFNHIQGFTPGSLYLGLYDGKNELVALSIWRKLKDTLYLDRYCTSSHVIGGLGKMLKYAKTYTQSLSLSHIVTFSDKEVSDGGLYEKLGFSVDKELRADYCYLYNKARVHKFNFRKSRFKKDESLKYEDGLSESQLAELNNIPRIWDCGKVRWIIDVHVV